MSLRINGLMVFSLVASLLWSALPARAGMNVVTYHYDNARTGANTNETVLTPANVASTNFGQIFNLPVDGYVYAQPLVVTNLTIPGKGAHDVVFVVTEHDSVYAFDANSNGAALWQVSFTNPAEGITTVNSSTDLGCGDLVPEVGITGTPVIDMTTGTIYICAKTKQVTNSVTSFHHKLHALSLTNGVEKYGGPVEVTATVAGTGDGNNGAGQVPFNPLQQNNREALLLNQGLVYVGSGSHCDDTPFHGWLLGYGAQTLTLSNVYNSTPNGSDGGFWQSGGGPSVDASNNIYVMSGNGSFDGAATNDYGDSFIKLATTNGLQLVDYFTPYDQAYLNSSDIDLGSGGSVVLPDNAGGGTTNHLLVGAGKEGTIYLLNRDNMGHYNPTNDNAIVQVLYFATGRSFDTPVYYNHTLYYAGLKDVMKAFTITNAQINPTPVGQGPTVYGFPGATPSLSANGTSNAIVWALQTDRAESGGPAILRAYNATNVAQELYNSTNAGTRDLPGNAVKFTVPTVANGKVYVGAQYALAVYGLGTFLGQPVFTPAGGVFTNSVSVTITDATPGTTIYYTQNNSAPTTSSTLYTGPFLLTNSFIVQARAFKANAANSGITTVTFLNSHAAGVGAGLTGAYYSNQLATFTNPPTLVRTDAVVNFDWSTSPPDAMISTNHFSVIWTGTVLPQFSETYTFYTTNSDGARLWVNGQLLVDDWMDQWPAEESGSLALAAGQQYPITMEYYRDGNGNDGGDATAALAWSSQSTPMAVIPQSQLYPSYAPDFFQATGRITNGVFNLKVAGEVGEGYVLLATTNLTTWVPIQTNAPAPDPDVALPTNIFNFSDSKTTNYPHRFYRTQQQQP